MPSRWTQRLIAKLNPLVLTEADLTVLMESMMIVAHFRLDCWRHEGPSVFHWTMIGKNTDDYHEVVVVERHLSPVFSLLRKLLPMKMTNMAPAMIVMRE
jgi:hypothetical protein